MANENYFKELYEVDIVDKVEKKQNLSYLSWAYAWAEVKLRHPDATFTIYENAQGWNYHTDGRTAWVKTGVTVNGIEHIEELPVMNNSNRSLPLASVTSFDVNKTIQRSLTKACARHGLGLKLYAGEDLQDAPETPQEPQKSSGKKKTTKKGADVTESKYEPAPFIEDIQTPAPKDDPARVALKKFIQDNRLDQAAVLSSCGIGPQSTHEDYVEALDLLSGGKS